MSRLGNLTDNFLSQVDNPDCSYLTGMFIGSGITMRMILYIFIIGMGFKIVDKLALDPLINYIKQKIKRKK